MNTTAKEQTNPLVVSVYEAARLLGLSEFTIRAWRRSKTIAYHKLGTRLMIPRAEIDRILIESRCERKADGVAGRRQAIDRELVTQDG